MSDHSNVDSRRRYFRNKTQKVIVLIDDKPYLALDWSPDGVSFAYDVKKLSSGDVINGSIDVYEVKEPGRFTGTVVRHSDDNILALKFSELSSHIFMNLCVSLGATTENTDP